MKSTPTKTGFTRVKTQSPRSRLAVATMVLIIGGLVFIGYFYIKDTGSLAVKPANSNSEIKGPHSDLVPTNDTKQHAMVAFPDMPKEPVTVSRIDSPDLPGENVELNMKSEDHKRSDTTVAGMEVEKMRRVTYQNGKTLYRIIIQTYGTYNDEILSKVLRANPDITGVTQIHEGQTIHLPAVAKYGRVSRSKDHQSLDKNVSVKKDERMNRVVFKNGQSLYRIIIHTYGTYNDKILNRVLHANPDIISPTKIRDGQTITLPPDKE